MSELIKILAERGYQTYRDVLINPSHIASVQDNYDHRARIIMCNGTQYDTCYTMAKFMEILNGVGGADG